MSHLRGEVEREKKANIVIRLSFPRKKIAKLTSSLHHSVRIELIYAAVCVLENLKKDFGRSRGVKVPIVHNATFQMSFVIIMEPTGLNSKTYGKSTQ